MGTCIDRVFRFGGINQAKTQKALGYIRKVQKKNAAYSGNGVCDFSEEPEECDGGFMQWHCYSKAGDDTPSDLREQLIELTIGGDFKFWYHWDCTDGCNDSSVEEHHDGVCIVDLLWEPGILGLEASIAAATLEVRSDAAAVLQLVDALLNASRCGWDENDTTKLENAHLAALTLAQAFQHWPHLLQDLTIQRTLHDVSRQLAVVHEGVDEYFLPDGKTQQERAALAALHATLEAELLKQSVPIPFTATSLATAGIRL